MKYNRREQLQRLLGDHGTVLPRQDHGTPARPAQGWYAKLTADERIVFLGDYTTLAAVTIGRLITKAERA